jgi:triosephosphate isomerase
VKTPKLIVANWKMNLTFNQTKEFCIKHANDFQQLQHKTRAKIIVCPSTESLALTATLLCDSATELGAQNCSSFTSGAYTGETSALSLAQVGCTYCIVGHSERRINFNETNGTIIQKAVNLLKVGITPIICIGEIIKQNSPETACAILADQLDPIISLATANSNLLPIIAYEPVWAIGTGSTPDKQYLERIFTWIANQWCIQISTPPTILYGGSVQPDSIKMLKQIPDLGGLLVGGASLDFQKFEKIVSLISE